LLLAHEFEKTAPDLIQAPDFSDKIMRKDKKIGAGTLRSEAILR
jgi:hypothetical protein